MALKNRIHHGEEGEEAYDLSMLIKFLRNVTGHYELLKKGALSDKMSNTQGRMLENQIS